jgi:hypothetical protein
LIALAAEQFPYIPIFLASLVLMLHPRYDPMRIAMRSAMGEPQRPSQ